MQRIIDFFHRLRAAYLIVSWADDHKPALPAHTSVSHDCTVWDTPPHAPSFTTYKGPMTADVIHDNKLVGVVSPDPNQDFDFRPINTKKKWA